MEKIHERDGWKSDVLRLLTFFVPFLLFFYIFSQGKNPIINEIITFSILYFIFYILIQLVYGMYKKKR